MMPSNFLIKKHMLINVWFSSRRFVGLSAPFYLRLFDFPVLIEWGEAALILLGFEIFLKFFLGLPSFSIVFSLDYSLVSLRLSLGFPFLWPRFFWGLPRDFLKFSWGFHTFCCYVFLWLSLVPRFPQFFPKLYNTTGYVSHPPLDHLFCCLASTSKPPSFFAKVAQQGNHVSRRLPSALNTTESEFKLVSTQILSWYVCPLTRCASSALFPTSLWAKLFVPAEQLHRAPK